MVFLFVKPGFVVPLDLPFIEWMFPVTKDMHEIMGVVEVFSEIIKIGLCVQV